MFLRAVIIWLVIALAEVLNGILRVRLFNRRVGDRRARQIGVFTGSSLILVIAWFSGRDGARHHAGQLLLLYSIHARWALPPRRAGLSACGYRLHGG